MNIAFNSFLFFRIFHNSFKHFSIFKFFCQFFKFCNVQRARGRVSTVAVNTLTFLAPIQVGSRTLFYADVVRVGNTSVTCKVEAYTEHNIHAPTEVRKVSEALFTYVAMDENDQPRPVDQPSAART